MVFLAKDMTGIWSRLMIFLYIISFLFNIAITKSFKSSCFYFTCITVKPLPCGMRILFIEKLLSSLRLINPHSYNIKLFGFMFLYPSIMDFIFYNYLLLIFIFHISFIIFILYYIFQLVSFFSIESLLINGLKWLWKMVGWRKSALIILPMLFLCIFSFFLIAFLLFGIIKLAEHWIIVVGIPIFVVYFRFLLLLLLFNSLFMILVKYPCHYVILFGIIWQ